MGDRSKVVRHRAGGWDGIPVRRYKADDGSHRDITRTTLLGGADDERAPASIVRYFEIAPGGYSSLERHRHAHSVVVVRGRGRVVLGAEVHDLGPLDCVYVAPDTFHQFHAGGTEPLGFLCIVDRERDRPRPPDAAELEKLAATAAGAILRAPISKPSS